MLENIGWVFEVVNDSWTELQNTDQKYKDYISDIIKSHDEERAEISLVDEINLKKNYYLTKTIDNNSIIYIDKPVDYILNPDDDRDYDDENYYKSWKENLRSRLNGKLPQQGGIGPNDFERWIKANEKLYLFYNKNSDINVPKNNYFAIYSYNDKSTKDNSIIYNYNHTAEEDAPAAEASPIVKSIKLTYDKKKHNIKIEFNHVGDREGVSIYYGDTFEYEDKFEDTNTSIFRSNGIPVLKNDFKFPTNNGRTYYLSNERKNSEKILALMKARNAGKNLADKEAKKKAGEKEEEEEEEEETTSDAETASDEDTASITPVTATPATDTNMTTPNNENGFLYYSEIENEKSDRNWIFLKDDDGVKIIMGEIIDKYKNLIYYKSENFNIYPHFFPFTKDGKIYIFIRTPTIDLINSENVNINLIDLNISPENSTASSPRSLLPAGDTPPLLPPSSQRPSSAPAPPVGTSPSVMNTNVNTSPKEVWGDVGGRVGDQIDEAVPSDNELAESHTDIDKGGGGKLVKIKFGNKKNINKSHDTGIKFIKAKKPEKSKLDKHLKK